MTAQPGAGLRGIKGAVAFGRSSAASGLFAEQFGGEPQALGGPLAISASHHVAGRSANLWSKCPCIVWDTRRDDYLRISNAHELDAIAPAIRAGLAWPALDDCVAFADDEGVLLFASGSGATTLYYSEHADGIVFANRPQALRAARHAATDRLGVGEIVRFGANYGRRTLLEGIGRIPIGHLLDCAPGKRPQQRSFIDYSHRPQADLDAAEMREAIGAALDRNLALVEGPRDLLFSGGVDSALLALRGIGGGTVQRGWFYAVGKGDPEQAIASQAAATIGLDLRMVQDRTTPGDIIDRIAAYALPTLDFSILPTHALGSAVVEANGPTTFIDGTGGDAWFGFHSLSHANSWHRLHRLRALSPAARSLYFAALPWEQRKELRPLKGLARAPALDSAALGHMCANPVYSSLLSLDADDWLTIEQELNQLMRSLTHGELGSAAGEVIVSDACLIAVAQFAAKTSQWNLAERSQTIYPFLLPNMVALGRTMPVRLLMRDGQAKPLLKDMVAASSLGPAFAFRRKSGFQPPLQRLLQDDRARRALALDQASDEVAWTPAARELPQRLLQGRNSLRISGLYAIWARLAIEFWLKSLRQ